MTRNILRLAALSSFAMSTLALATLINASTASAQETIQNCHIDKAVKNGMLKLESLFGNAEAGSGTYKLSVRSLGGSNNVSSKSGGQFSKAKDEIVLLGKSFLTARGNVYEIKLDVNFNGETYDCVEKIKTSMSVEQKPKEPKFLTVRETLIYTNNLPPSCTPPEYQFAPKTPMSYSYSVLRHH